MANNTNTGNPDTFHKQKHKDEMIKQLITFVLMIVFTIIAFVVVLTGMDKFFAIPLLLLLAVVQVGFQFYYFMHMKDKGHEMPSLMIYGGIGAAIVTVLALTLIIWW
ncbi:cytochrome c oxidase subunit IVB [Ornithinibacillus sp. L9]|uniref:Cytochrome c oxidase subunit IVB n=1 Tax=Ornithinibacillus caprae TaxID=2678566 RepID=A0A6N8FIY1_9BACI|nr:cytochrome c oxidase subunit IVB [Ornithinibacillus caprae]MUK89560.1 cytochrome c oxidase subunit IVB [Ornithinibacillus caprae]